MTPRLVKVEGTGNDFLLGGGRWAGRLAEDASLVRALCDRRRGIGADGVLALTVRSADRVRVVHRNADGSEAPFCGNGTRCAARASVELFGCAPDLVVETDWCAVPAEVRGSWVTLLLPPPAMPPRRLQVDVAGSTVEGYALEVGVPHLVVPVPDPAEIEIDRVAPPLRNHAELGPGGANVDLVAEGGPEPVAIRTWERGVESETLSCGSGVVAAALVLMTKRGVRRLQLRPTAGDVLVVEALGEPPMCGVRFTGATRIVAEVEPRQELLPRSSGE